MCQSCASRLHSQRHIDDLELDALACDALPVGFQDDVTATLALAHNRAGLKIKHHDQLLMLPPDRDLIGGDELQAIEPGTHELALKIALANVLDQAPVHLEMPGDIENDHVPKEL